MVFLAQMIAVVAGYNHDCIVSVITGLQGIPNNTYLMIRESHAGEVSLDKIKPPLIRTVAIVLFILIHATLVAPRRLTSSGYARPAYGDFGKIV